MKLFEKKIIVCAFSILLIFTCGCALILSFVIPESAVIGENESAQNVVPNGCRWLFAVKSQKSDSVMENNAKKLKHDENTLNSTVYICGILPVKNIDISVMKQTDVALGGECMGIKLKTNGVLVVGIEDNIQTESGVKESPGKKSGIRVGDVIEIVNGTKVSSAKELANEINKTNGTAEIYGKRSDKEMMWSAQPVTDEKSEKKIGVWVRDNIAGIGTVTFYAKDKFASLGHPISDIDTGNRVDDNGGSICKASIVGIEKSKSGAPGSIKGIFTGGNVGIIDKNTPYGVYGTANQTAAGAEEKLQVARRSEVRGGDAKIYCDIGDGVQAYDIKIDRLLQNGDETKSMIIKITDKNLIEKTGGIVRGMSGAPIVQNGKLSGAVTHVFVNDPTSGYAIFADRMLSETVNAN